MFFRYIILAALTLFTRFIGLSWGNGSFFHPDENNMVRAVMQLSPDNYNPHFFAYGQFPLYLAHFTIQLLRLEHTHTIVTNVLRFWSASFSAISVYYFFLISKKIFKIKLAFISTLIFILVPGLIQLAHFGTTESLLILVFLINLYCSYVIFSKPLHYQSYIMVSLVTGIGLASKLSSLIFLFPVFLVSMINFFKSSKKLSIIFLSIYCLLFCFIFFIIFSPYNLVEKSDFLSALSYETDVATGRMMVFYTRQFAATQDYIFQITKIFPYALGLPLFVLSIFAVFIALINRNKYWYLALLSSLVYFIYFGQLYVKWSRFMSPIFFIFALTVPYIFQKIHHSFLKIVMIVITILPGLYFLKLYFSSDIRHLASDWMVQNIPEESVIFSEGGNVIDIPIILHKFAITNFDFYTLENSPLAHNSLISMIDSADYILVPSRRVFMNYRFSYHQHLFDGSLGFTEIKRFTPDVDLFLNPENAEETWTVFDRPTIRIFKKTQQKTISEYSSMLSD